MESAHSAAAHSAAANPAAATPAAASGHGHAVCTHPKRAGCFGARAHPCRVATVGGVFTFGWVRRVWNAGGAGNARGVAGGIDVESAHSAAAHSAAAHSAAAHSAAANPAAASGHGHAVGTHPKRAGCFGLPD